MPLTKGWVFSPWSCEGPLAKTPWRGEYLHLTSPQIRPPCQQDSVVSLLIFLKFPDALRATWFHDHQISRARAHWGRDPNEEKNTPKGLTPCFFDTSMNEGILRAYCSPSRKLVIACFSFPARARSVAIDTRLSEKRRYNSAFFMMSLVVNSRTLSRKSFRKKNCQCHAS